MEYVQIRGLGQLHAGEGGFARAVGSGDDQVRISVIVTARFG